MFLASQHQLRLTFSKMPLRGYIRILKCGFRSGDTAPMAYVELVDRPIAEDLEDDED